MCPRSTLEIHVAGSADMTYQAHLGAPQETLTRFDVCSQEKKAAQLAALDAQYQAKIMAEVERYQALAQEKEALNGKWDEQNATLVEAHEKARTCHMPRDCLRTCHMPCDRLRALVICRAIAWSHVSYAVRSLARACHMQWLACTCHMPCNRLHLCVSQPTARLCGLQLCSASRHC